MKGRDHFSAEEAEQIRELLARVRDEAPGSPQKLLRDRLRGMGFYISDWPRPAEGFALGDFDDLVQDGLIKITGPTRGPIESRAYLQTWTDGVTAARESEGQLLEYAGSNQYQSLDVQPGDVIYVAYLDAKRLHLIGRLPVDELIDHKEARRRRDENLWEADWYVVAVTRSADAFRFDLRIPDEVVRRLRFERSTGETTKLHPATDGSLDGKALQRIRRLTPESAALLDSLHDLEQGRPGRGVGRRPDKKERQAVERRAMEVVEDDYTARNWTVQRVHLTRPYDLVCRRGGVEHHVEVKGLTGAATAVELTRNEVTHARTCRQHLVLAVVEMITLKRNGPPMTTGGRLRMYDPWLINDGGLEPMTYAYRLP